MIGVRVLEKSHKRPPSAYAISRAVFIIPACWAAATHRNKMVKDPERDVWALLSTAEREFLGQLGHFHFGAGLDKSLALSLELLTVAQA